MRYSRGARLTAFVAVLLAGGIALAGCSAGDRQQQAMSKVEAIEGPKGWSAGPILPVCAVITPSCNDPSVNRLFYAPQHTTPQVACTIGFEWAKVGATKAKIDECTQWLRTHPNVNPRKWGGAFHINDNFWVNATANMGASVYGYMYAVGVGF